MSFLVTRIQDAEALAAARESEGWTGGKFAPGGLAITLANNSVPFSIVENGESVLVLFGEIANRDELRRMLAMFDSASLTASDSEIASLLRKYLGDAGMAFIDGAFVLVEWDARSGTISAMGDVLGQYPLYASPDSSPWIAPNPRLVCRKPGMTPHFQSVEEVITERERPDDYTPVVNILRAKPGTVLRFGSDGREQPIVCAAPFHQLRRRSDRCLIMEDAIRAIEASLIPAIRSAFGREGRAWLPLSGGVDSSIVAAFGARYTNLATIAFGTSRSNEYVPSKRVADHIGSDHHEIEITTDEILSGMFGAIFHNGIFDGYAAEVQAGLFAIMERLRDKADLIVTGYGADLLLGGTMHPGMSCDIDINLELWKQVYRTRWSGEFSPVGANMTGLQIRHPFWTPRFIGLCLDMAGQLKVSETEVKVVLRRFAEEQQILPHETVWRKKLAMHHGSAIEDILSDALGTLVDPVAKQRFTYALYRATVTGDLHPTNFDPDRALAEFKHAV